MASKTKYWITKWAFTHGIIVAECDPPRKGYVHVEFPYGPEMLGVLDMVEVGTHAHKTRKAALAKFGEMMDAKVKSHENQIEKLKAKAF